MNLIGSVIALMCARSQFENFLPPRDNRLKIRLSEWVSCNSRKLVAAWSFNGASLASLRSRRKLASDGRMSAYLGVKN
jgi:hypothetical protein